MICPNCNILTSNSKGHMENPWACIAILKERNIRLQNQVVELQMEVEELKADLHATESLLEVEKQFELI
ncbi:MAG: hypothetical protein HY819_03925 [Acidobacteria bacterium]|nr:hypothetical protein [Acidobacteriota bacterium]